MLAFDLLVGGVGLEDRCAGETEELRVGEEVLDGPVVVAELRAVAFVEDEHHALVAQGFQALFVFALVVAIKREAKLLDGGNNDLIGVIVGEQAPHQRFGIGVFFDAAFLELVEFFPCLPVKILAINDEQAFFDVWIVLEQG